EEVVRSGVVLPSATPERFDLINGQVEKIALIVKGFLQRSAKPVSQTQLVDLNLIAEKSVGIIGPRVDSMGVEIRRKLDRTLGPLRVVPMDLEQILLNLLNNSLDSLGAKAQRRERTKLLVEVSSHLQREGGQEWAELRVYDTGEGIKKSDLGNVLKPFFTTKRPEQGTGLGLTICKQLAQKYGGTLELDSREGSWTRVVVRLPYRGINEG
ncbi:HAMP domain-containing sensor histidine kinase, partial [Bdellovibrionota bacterium FG-2]